ncbi:sodium:proton antiporter [Leptolyngbya sp. FACHB-16]|uniref:cation:proton antiporter n=1 Tax=unclassified Leptolyngbya TaxID=2650499 RepID=UPI00168A120B|nr:sodium:proton antiporter [Leptolyngbya sp. FACHB-16]MBD1911628.1 sodium:proton antiporter [Leptolyngbya sp. FACHB-8]MBD2153193.1 sodium:proton antiporter [Leptolyngbya sp. FACHB-16]
MNLNYVVPNPLSDWLPAAIAVLPVAESGSKESLAQVATTLTILLLVATGVALLSRRFRVPYVTGLVLAGLGVTQLLPNPLHLDSALILNLLLPILLFQAAINTDVSRLRSTIKPISLLAGPGVALAAGITATVLKFALNLEWIPALLLGTILAITDTVSVIAVFKEVSVPSRLTTIVEGESLFNDGVALVLFSLILEVYTRGSVTVLAGLQQLVVVIVGGALVGLAIGSLCAVLFVSLSDDPLSGILLTVAVAFGTFQAGHGLQVSGVVAVVVAGLTVGNRGLNQSVSASSKITLLNFWEYADFCVNTFIFLLIGLEVEPRLLWNIIPSILLTILAYQVGRVLSVYPLLAISNRFDLPIPLRWQHVLFLGNIKGSLSMVLALSLPASLPGRSDLIALVYGAVFVSLIGQALSLPWLVKRLNIAAVSEFRQQIEALQSQLIAAKAAQNELAVLHDTGVLPKSVYEEMRSSYQVQVAEAEKQLRDLHNRRTDPLISSQGGASKLNAVRRRLLMVERGALNDAIRKRIISEEVVTQRLRSIDDQLFRLEDE